MLVGCTGRPTCSLEAMGAGVSDFVVVVDSSPSVAEEPRQAAQWLCGGVTGAASKT